MTHPRGMRTYSEEAIPGLLQTALGSALTRIAETVQSDSSTPAQVADAMRNLSLLAAVLVKGKPGGNEPGAVAYSKPQVAAAIADLVREHDSPELRRLLEAGPGAIMGEEGDNDG